MHIQVCIVLNRFLNSVSPQQFWKKNLFRMWQVSLLLNFHPCFSFFLSCAKTKQKRDFRKEKELFWLYWLIQSLDNSSFLFFYTSSRRTNYAVVSTAWCSSVCLIQHNCLGKICIYCFCLLIWKFIKNMACLLRVEVSCSVFITIYHLRFFGIGLAKSFILFWSHIPMYW